MNKSRVLNPIASSIVFLVTVCTLVLGSNTGFANAASPSRQQAPTASAELAVHVVKTEYVSSVAPNTGVGFTNSTRVVSTGSNLQISCGQYLTYYISKDWDIWGTNITILALDSVDYTQWCSGRVYTMSYHIFCRSLNYGVYNFTCLGGYSSGVLGQGTALVNPWYNQPVRLTYWTGVWHTETAVAYGRNYMSSNGGWNAWWALNL